MARTTTYDVTIAFRVYPGVSKTPFIHSDNKLKLTETGIRTLRQSLGGKRARFLFLLDNCPPEYRAMILSQLNEADVVFHEYPGIGNLATFKKQIELLLTQTDSDIIMFAEDDYVYRKNELRRAVQLMANNPEADFVTPYDHLDSYTLAIHTAHEYRIMSAEGIHWRTSASTCLTFLTRKSVLSATRRTFESYSKGNWDSSLWFSLTGYNIFNVIALLTSGDTFRFKIIARSWWHGWRQNLFGRRYTLWQPMPSIATHMEKISLAPGIDWDQVVADSEKE
jgi:hypothetical protein